MEALLNHQRLKADIVRRVDIFDPNFLLGMPMEQATFCSTSISQSFNLSGRLEGSPEVAFRDEYLEFIDHFRQIPAALKDSLDGLTYMIDVLSSMLEVRGQPHLFRLFRLSCLCLTEGIPFLPLLSSKMWMHRDRFAGLLMFCFASNHV